MYDLAELKYFKALAKADTFLTPHYEMYIASFRQNDFGHTPENMKERLLLFFPELKPVFKAADIALKETESNA